MFPVDMYVQVRRACTAVYGTRVVRPPGRRIQPCDVRWSTRIKCAPALNRRSQSATGRAAGFA